MTVVDPLLVISDTTLRDGVQASRAMLKPGGRLRIAAALESAGVRSIESGFPAVGRREVEEMQAVALASRQSIQIALCRTIDSDIDAARAAFERIPRLRCGVNLFLGTSPIHRDRKLRMTRQEVLSNVTKAVTYSRRYFNIVSFGAEDATRTEPEFLAEVYRAAIKAGVTSIGFPDTVGIFTPEETFAAVAELRSTVVENGVKLGVHFHNDLGLATANTLAAVLAGADIVQCTVNGMGERAGNAALEEVVANLSVHKRIYKRRTTVVVSRLNEISSIVAENTSVPVAPWKAVVGSHAFSTAAGLHQDGILKDPATYLPFPPSLVGMPATKFVLGPYSGRKAVVAYLSSLGHKTNPKNVDRILKRARIAAVPDELLEMQIDDPQFPKRSGS